MNKHTSLFWVALLLEPLAAAYAAGDPVTVGRTLTPHPTEAKLTG